MQDRLDDERFDAVLVAEPARVAEASEAIGLAGGRVLATLPWARADELMQRALGRPVLVVEAEGVAEPVVAAALPAIREMAETLDLNLVAVMTLSQVDGIADALMGPAAQLLCEPSMGERVAALAVAGRMPHEMMIADSWREGEAEKLKKLNEEVARIARLLAGLASRGQSGDGGDEVGDRHLSFGFLPPAVDVDPQAIRQTIRGRRLRDAFFGKNLFEDPAWDMLLDLYAAHLEGGRVSVSSLCIAAEVAPTTALRWIGKMTELELFERQPDPDDRRRAFMALSPRALNGMGGYIASARRAGVPIA